MGLSTDKEKKPSWEVEGEASKVRRKNRTNKAVMLLGVKCTVVSEESRAGATGSPREEARHEARGASRNREEFK